MSTDEFGFEPEEELDEFGFEPEDSETLSLRELSSADIFPEDDKMGAAAAALSGFGRGASFGFSDELGGLIGAASDYLGSSDSSEEDVLSTLTPEARAKAEALGIDATPVETPKKSFKDLLDEYTEVQRKYQDKAVEDQPLASTAGMIAGGFAVPGASMKGGVTLANMAKQGAGLGAVAGFGESEGGLQERLKGATKGAAFGAATGAALPALKGLGSQIKRAGKAISETDMGKIFRYEKMGERLGENVSENLIKLSDLGGDITEKLYAKSGRIKENIMKTMNRASRDGATVNMNQVKNSIMDDLSPLRKNVSEPDNPFFKAQVAFAELRKNAAQKVQLEYPDLFRQYKIADTPEAKAEIAQAIKGKIDDQLDNVPLDEAFETLDDIKHIFKFSKSATRGVKTAAKKVNDLLKDTIEEFVPTVKDDYKQMSEILSMYQMLAKKKPSWNLEGSDVEAIRKRFQPLLMQADKNIKGKTELEDILRGFKNARTGKNIPGLSEIDPQLASKLKTGSEELAEKIRLGLDSDAAAIKSVSPSIKGQIAASAGGGLGLAAKGGKYAGRAAKATKDFSSKTIRSAGDTITSITPQKVQELTRKFVEIGKPKYAEAMAKLEGKSDAAKRAAIFSLMQTPGFREAIRQVEDED